MLVKRGYKVEIDLNNEQRTACMQHAGAARWAYNYALTRKKENYKAGLKTPYASDLHKEINVLKQATPWMRSVECSKIISLHGHVLMWACMSSSGKFSTKQHLRVLR